MKELLSLIPQDVITAHNAYQECPELVDQKIQSEESLKHELLQVYKRMLKLKYEPEDRSDEAFLTWKIKGITYKWGGYTKCEDSQKAVYKIAPNLFAVIDPTLDLGTYDTKFHAALTHMAQTAHGTQGVKYVGKGYELKILGVGGAGDARLFASKI